MIYSHVSSTPLQVPSEQELYSVAFECPVSDKSGSESDMWKEWIPT